MPRWRNWARTVTARPRRVHRPASEAELAALIGRAPGPVKVAGSGHSCGPIAAADDGTGLILLDRLDRVLAFSEHDVTVEAGMPLRRLNDFLAERGRALLQILVVPAHRPDPNLARHAGRAGPVGREERTVG